MAHIAGRRHSWGAAVAATSVECVAPASRVGARAPGVRCALQRGVFGEDVEYQYSTDARPAERPP